MRSAAAISSSVARREVSPVEVAEEALRLADAWQPATNAFTQLRPEESIREARELAERLAGGDAPGPLAGVPLAVKELFDVAGWESTGCCAAFRGRVAHEDARIVRRLREAGTVVVGKTNQHELAAGATNLVSSYGTTRNPWDPDRITGGSSGGSGAAVAAGVVPVALGSDTGGSIRIPASLCGVTGIKPTTGRISMEGAMPLAPSLDAPGPLTRTAADALLVLAVISGRPVEARPGRRTVKLLTSGYGTLAREDVLSATSAAADVLVDAGISILPGEVTGIDDAPEVWERVGWPEFAMAYPGLATSEGVHPRTREVLAYGERARDGLPAARERAAEIRRAFLDALQGADALLLPTTPLPATTLDEREFPSVGVDIRTGGPSVITRPVNLSGLPAISFPAGFSSEGVPIGAQLIGRPDGEGVLLDLVAEFQRRTSHHEAMPRRAGEASGP
jgi:aspartyl-tRNA(Asn)/glutamyl-tRNA(Gln) amidotransferase subunit A